MVTALRIFKTKTFKKQRKDTALEDRHIIHACIKMKNGLVNADYGSHLYKKRIALPGSGKSGGYRSIISAKIGERFFFIYFQEQKKQILIRQKNAL
jgi:hypothetical protein